MDELGPKPPNVGQVKSNTIFDPDLDPGSYYVSELATLLVNAIQEAGSVANSA